MRWSILNFRLIKVYLAYFFCPFLVIEIFLLILVIFGYYSNLCSTFTKGLVLMMMNDGRSAMSKKNHI